MVKMFNLWYFFFIVFAVAVGVGAYFALKNKSKRTQKIVLGSLLFANLILHFVKILFPPYAGTVKGASEVGFITLCSVSVFMFPFFFLSKSKYAKDFMFYFGLLSGAAALFIPTEAVTGGFRAMTFFVWRFYIMHMIICIVPTLMVALGLHKLDYRRIWKMPFYCVFYYLFIIVNQVLQVELGLVPERQLTVLLDKYPDFHTQNFFEYKYKNPSLLWGPDQEYAGITKAATLLTPDFMKTVPFGEFKGQPMYWPLFYLLPTVFFLLWTLPFILCIPFEHAHIKADFIYAKTLARDVCKLFRGDIYFDL